MQRSISAYFITLTYKNEALTWADFEDFPRKGEIFSHPVANTRDIQLFFKKLRYENKKLTSQKIKYFLVSEYGPINGRPHYHGIVFNCASPDLVRYCWPHGFVYSPVFRPEGTAYLLKYLHKRDDGLSNRFPDLPRVFLCSKGLGSNYMTPAILEYHRGHIPNCFVRSERGALMAMPKYYKERIYNDEQRLAVTHHMQKFADLALSKKILKVAQEESITPDAALTLIERRQQAAVLPPVSSSQHGDEVL